MRYDKYDYNHRSSQHMGAKLEKESKIQNTENTAFGHLHLMDKLILLYQNKSNQSHKKTFRKAETTKKMDFKLFSRLKVDLYHSKIFLNFYSDTNINVLSMFPYRLVSLEE